MKTADTSVRLPRREPQELGISPAALDAFISELGERVHEMHSIMLLRRGAVILEGWWKPYLPETPHVLFSLSKSFASSGAGIAVGEGRFSLDDRVTSFFPDDLPSRVSPNLAAMRVRHLLAMATGHDRDVTGETFGPEHGSGVRGFLHQEVQHVPGTHFAYNSAATYMISAIVQKCTGETLLQYLTPRLLAPLGIEGATWDSCGQGINMGGWGMKVRTEDIASFGQLYLQDGVWEGQRRLPEGWVENATRIHVSNGDNPESDWNQGYGFKFWRCRNGAYRGDGAFGQYCVVMPEQEMVLAITSGIKNMQEPLDIVWKHLLPAARQIDTVGGNIPGAKPHDLRISMPSGRAHSPREKEASGRTYTLEPNPQDMQTLRLDFAEDRIVLTIDAKDGTDTIFCSLTDEWPDPLAEGSRQKIVGAARWSDEDTLVIKLCYSDGPFCATFNCRPTGEAITGDRTLNVSFGPTEPEPFAGVA